MVLFHRVVIGHSQYHSTDTRNTSLGRILQKISCLPRRLVISGLGLNTLVLAPKNLLYLLDTQYTIFLGTGIFDDLCRYDSNTGRYQEPPDSSSYFSRSKTLGCLRHSTYQDHLAYFLEVGSGD